MQVEDFARVHPAQCHGCYSAESRPVVDWGHTVIMGTSRYRVYTCMACVRAAAKALIDTGKADWALVTNDELNEYQSRAIEGERATERMVELEQTLATLRKMLTTVDL